MEIDLDKSSDKWFKRVIIYSKIENWYNELHRECKQTVELNKINSRYKDGIQWSKKLKKSKLKWCSK